MKLLLATSNPHKLEEVRAVLGDAVELLSLADAGVDIPEPVEDGDTFEANARIKAEAYAAAAGMPTLADDSGLAVDALSGAPGVISARYAADDFKERWDAMPRAERDRANNAKLLRALEGVPADERGARFVCVMALVSPGEERDAVVTEGVYPGRIILPSEAADPFRPELGRGRHGFGYDPLLVLGEQFPEHAGKTSAELTPEQKNAISHRGDAARRLRGRLVPT